MSSYLSANFDLTLASAEMVPGSVFLLSNSKKGRGVVKNETASINHSVAGGVVVNVNIYAFDLHKQ